MFAWYSFGKKQSCLCFNCEPFLIVALMFAPQANGGVAVDKSLSFYVGGE